MIAVLKISCPPMATRHVSKGLSQTDELLASWTLTRKDTGVILATGQILFPKTFVDVIPGHILSWLVRVCRAYTPQASDPVQIVSNLPPEPCEVRLINSEGKFDFHMDVKGIWAPTTVTLPDLGQGSGSVYYPDTRADHTAIGIFTVRAVEAEGEITFP